MQAPHTYCCPERGSQNVRVVFKSGIKDLFDLIQGEFKLALKEDNTQKAKIEYDEEKLIFLTGTGNKWFTKTDEKGNVYLGYEGTRKDLIELRPFQNLYWLSSSEDKATLGYVDDWTFIEYVDPILGNVYLIERIPKRIRDFTLKLVEYKTSLPPEWDVQWYELIEITSTKTIKAVQPQKITELLQSQDGYIAFIGRQDSTPRVIVPCKDQCEDLKD